MFFISLWQKRLDVLYVYNIKKNHYVLKPAQSFTQTKNLRIYITKINHMYVVYFYSYIILILLFLHTSIYDARNALKGSSSKNDMLFWVFVDGMLVWAYEDDILIGYTKWWHFDVSCLMTSWHISYEYEIFDYRIWI